MTCYVMMTENRGAISKSVTFNRNISSLVPIWDMKHVRVMQRIQESAAEIEKKFGFPLNVSWINSASSGA